ncbi:MAG: recombinase family protein [Lachnospiraceae bacterium]|nr:recombinase family protein [Lachnospiraceae bacterium]
MAQIATQFDMAAQYDIATQAENRNANTNTILPGYGQIAFYLRLSVADGDLGRGKKDESNSIENQRLLLQEFLIQKLKREDCPVGMNISAVKEEKGEQKDTGISKDTAISLLIEANPVLRDFFGSVSEYVDDGYSGTNFDRPSFRKMIEDAKAGRINTILVKDTSRLGRDYIDVGDYMEQIFPLLNIRFIAVNNNYDSNQYRDTTMGIENSIMNLVNTEYSRDLSRKITSARQTLWRQGISTSGMAPFGYKRVGRKYVPDPVTAPTVRMIFEKALGGWNCPMIVNLLNEQAIPTPGAYRLQTTGYAPAGRVVSDKEWLWDISKVHKVLKNYSYTGAMVHGKFRSLTVGSKKRRNTDRKDWYILDGEHEPIVSVEEWEAAQAAINTVPKVAYRNEVDFCLKGKVRCGNCGLMMEYNDTAKQVVYCSHSKSAGKASACCQTRHDAKWIIAIVEGELHRQLQILKFLELSIERYGAERRKQGDRSYYILKKRTESELEVLKSEKVRQYEAYAEGVISREEYTKKRDEIADKTARLEEKLRCSFEAESEEKGILRGLSGVRKEAERMEGNVKKERLLTRETVQAFINVVKIYDEETVEVSFNFEDVGRRAMNYIEKKGIVVDAGGSGDAGVHISTPK